MVSFHVLRCAQCHTFQVLQVTKTHKWTCKLCGLKQSVTKVFGQGTAADCRRHVQKLNSLRGEITNTTEEQHLRSTLQAPFDSSFRDSDNPSYQQLETARVSRWSSFLDEPNDEVEEQLLNDDSHRESVIKVTTDWAEYKESKNICHKRKAERNYGFSKMPNKKGKVYCGHSTMFDSSEQHFCSSQHLDNTSQSLNHTVDSSCDSHMYLPQSYASDTPSMLPSSSVANEGNTGSSMNSQYQFSTRVKTAGRECVGSPDIGYSSNISCNYNQRGVDRNVSAHVLSTQKDKPKKTASNRRLIAKIPVASKWNVFLETEEIGNDDDDATYCEYQDSADIITDCKLLSSSASVRTEHFTQGKKSDNTKQYLPIVEQDKCDQSDRFQSKPSGWLKDSVVTKAVVADSTECIVTSASSGCGDRGMFDLGLEISGEDLLL